MKIHIIQQVEGGYIVMAENGETAFISDSEASKLNLIKSNQK